MCDMYQPVLICLSEVISFACAGCQVEEKAIPCMGSFEMNPPSTCTCICIDMQHVIQTNPSCTYMMVMKWGWCPCGGGTFHVHASISWPQLLRDGNRKVEVEVNWISHGERFLLWACLRQPWTVDWKNVTNMCCLYEVNWVIDWDTSLPDLK